MLSGMTSKVTGVKGATRTYALIWKLSCPSPLPRSDRGTVTCIPLVTKLIDAEPTGLKHER